MTTAARSGVSLRRARSIVAGRSRSEGEELPVENPANLDRPVGLVLHATPEVAQDAADAAVAASHDWSALAPVERIAILERARSRWAERRDELARLITLENGKTTAEARLEVDGALTEAGWQLGHLTRALDAETLSCSPTAQIRRSPVGPCLLVTPWNFPLATVVRKLVPALACGNTVVLKPSELTPLSVDLAFEQLSHAGLPAGVANLVIGTGEEVGPTLLGHPDLVALSFTGSTATGRALDRTVAGRGVRVQAEMGGKNALVLLEGGDEEAAAEAVLQSGFSCAGQWCTGTSRVIVAENRYDSFVARLAERVRALRIGPGERPTTDMGPVITASARDAIDAAVEAAIAGGASVVHRHDPALVAELPRGNWSRPTLLGDVTPDLPIAREEVFGPVVVALPCHDAAHALELVNGTEYGLSCSLYAPDDSAASEFLDGVEAGVCHLNLPTHVRSVAAPFSGWKASGSGEAECGDAARRFFTREKAVYRA